MVPIRNKTAQKPVDDLYVLEFSVFRLGFGFGFGF